MQEGSAQSSATRSTRCSIGQRQGRAIARSWSRPSRRADSYNHTTAEVASRPEIGTQAQFRQKRPPKTYKYDSSLSPALDWDGQNAAREQGEALIQRILSAKSRGTP
jgi:adenine-specific DNA-methyltransferase